MKKNGFTLIELLAVIVILAIIALIATPIVINIINDSKKESINRSIELYIDHVQKMIAKEQMKDPTFNPSKCKINEGNLTCDGKIIQIEMKGQMPKSGTIKFSKGMVIEGVNLELHNLYYQVKEDKISEGTKEKVKSYSDYITKVSDADHDDKVSPGDEYTYEVMDNMEEPYTFYVLSIEGDKVNLIMNSNICSDGTPADKDHQCNYAWHAGEDNNNYGPDIAMTNLYNATKDWTNVPNMIMEYADENNNGTNYGYTGISTDANTKVTTITGKQNKTSQYQTFGNATEPLKARLPREDEVTSQDAGCHVWSSNADYGTCSAWLVENLYYDSNFSSYCSTCSTKYSINNNNGITNISGYWLLSSSPGYTLGARHVDCHGRVGNINRASNASRGLRAVITVSKSDLSN